MFLQFFVTAFVLFAISRVWLRYRDGSIGVLGTIIWSAIWIGVEAFVWWPKVTDVLARKIGIGSGAQALVYFAIIILFYAVFRLYVMLEYIQHELTNLTRALALRDNERQPPKQP